MGKASLINRRNRYACQTVNPRRNVPDGNISLYDFVMTLVNGIFPLWSHSLLSLLGGVTSTPFPAPPGCVQLSDFEQFLVRQCRRLFVENQLVSVCQRMSMKQRELHQLRVAFGKKGINLEARFDNDIVLWAFVLHYITTYRLIRCIFSDVV